MVTEVISKFLLYFQNFKVNDIANIATILFGVTAGLLSLIGILAVFLVFNTQQRAYKARELYWDLCGMAEISKDIDMPLFIMRKLQFYRMLTKKQNDITFAGISITKQAIITVIIMWNCFSLLWVMNTGGFDSWFVMINIIIASALLIKFIHSVDALNDILSITHLPSYEHLLDGSIMKPDIKSIEIGLKGSVSFITRLADEMKYMFLNSDDSQRLAADIKRYIQTGSFGKDSELSAEIIKIAIWFPAPFVGIECLVRFEYWLDGQICYFSNKKFDICVDEEFQRSSIEIRFPVPQSIRHYEKVKLLIDFKSNEGSGWIDLDYRIEELLSLPQLALKETNKNIGSRVIYDDELRKIIRSHITKK